MLKNCAKRKIIVTGFTFLIFIITLAIPKNEEKIKNIDISYTSSTPRPIYVMNKDNYIARINIAFKNSEPLALASEVIAYLTIGSEKNEYLPANFYAVIPKDTKVSNISLEKDTLKIDFNKTLLNGNTRKIKEALVYSLTEIDGIKKVIIYVEGKLLDSENQYFTRELGINTLYDLDSFKNVCKTTVYYVANENDSNYYIPITLLNNDEKDKLEVIIERLKTRPFVKTNLMSYLNARATLKDYEYDNEKILLSFNDSLYSGISNDELKEVVNYSLVLSIKDSLNVSEVVIK